MSLKFLHNRKWLNGPLAVSGQGMLRLLLLGALLLTHSASAQELDLEDLHSRMPSTPAKSNAKTQQPLPAAANSTGMTVGKPLSATISKTLYLPPAMYGQWSVTGVLIESNAKLLFSPTVNDIWILQREEDQVTITNPANGATATISVDKVEGNQATFHREGKISRNRFYQEIPTITVQGDVLTGQTINRIRHMKAGQITREYYAVYNLQAARISGARTRFKPEREMGGPDIEIEEVRR